MSRALTPWGWLAAAVGLVLAVVLLAAVWNGLWSWLPWSAERQAERAKAEAAAAVDQADAATLTAEGHADQIRRIETVHRQIIEVETVTAAAVAEARGATDADSPLDPDRLGRLRAHDRELCRIAGDRPGCPAAPDPAR